MHTLRVVAAFAASLILSSCASTQSAGAPKRVPIVHRYSLDVIGVDRKRLKGALISYETSRNLVDDRYKSSGTAICDGNNPVAINLNPMFAWSHDASYTSLSGSVHLDGYFDQRFHKSILDQGNVKKVFASEKIDITLIKPADYIGKGVLSTLDQESLELLVSKLITVGRSASVAYELHKFPALGESEYKGKKYFSVKLDGDQKYNSLKLNQYEIGRKVFDGIVGKICPDLQRAAGSSYDGYQITFTTLLQDFSAGYGGNSLTYDYYLPRKDLSKYLAQDISGQQLLDGSIVLINGYRAEIRLR